MQVINRIDRIFFIVYAVIIALVGIIVWFASGREIVGVVTVVVELLYLAFILPRPLRRYRAVQKPFPVAWRSIITQHSIIYPHLDESGKRHFERDIQIFLSDFSIEGIRRQHLDIDLKLPIATAFATMLFGRPDWEPPIKDGVIVYPGRNFDRHFKIGRGFFEGIATVNSPLIVTEESLQQSFAFPGDGDNVVFHELAHYFDFEDGVADGIPMARLDANETNLLYWRETVRQEWERVQRGDSYLRPYAGTNEAELFAVAVETFFENPLLMAAHSPEFYQLLKEFFNLDPAALTRRLA